MAFFLTLLLGFIIRAGAADIADSAHPPGEPSGEEMELEEPNPVELSARVDSLYSSNNVLAQGFSIPSLRLTAGGELFENLDFQLSAGQSREYTSLLLPQLIPSEAFIRWGEGEDSLVRFRAGMFNPIFSPSWTPDLSYLSLPDYHETHKRILLNRDIGAEITLRPFEETFELTLGFFNGNGILAMNTNDSKAVTVSGNLNLPIGSAKLSLGGSGYLLNQSSQGRGNFKANWVTDAFVALESESFALTLDGFTGRFEDNSRIVFVNGGAGFLKIHFMGCLFLFARLESLDQDPIDFSPITHYDFGPILQWHERFTAFFLYDTLLLGNQSRANGVTIRFRASL